MGSGSIVCRQRKKPCNMPETGLGDLPALLQPTPCKAGEVVAVGKRPTGCDRRRRIEYRMPVTRDSERRHELNRKNIICRGWSCAGRF